MRSNNRFYLISFLRRIEKEKQDSLISNFTKIQAECRDLNKADKDNKQHIENLKKQTEKLSEDNSNLTQQNNNKDIKVRVIFSFSFPFYPIIPIFFS